MVFTPPVMLIPNRIKIDHSIFNHILNMTPKHLKIKTSEPGELHPIYKLALTLPVCC
jgi:hypothetical protein